MCDHNTDLVFQVAGVALQSLDLEFRSGPIEERESTLTEKELVDQVDGLRITVRSREHGPPHFHVEYQGEDASFEICSGNPLVGGALRKWTKTIREWHKQNRATLIATWNRNRPTDCPVGPVTCKEVA
ncbi:MAG: DUF4160 domain-containing protein [Planctomycetes bacterium]|nr:DUF4160 domain-containing protein [Planctomycetota bacterium]